MISRAFARFCVRVCGIVALCLLISPVLLTSCSDGDDPVKNLISRAAEDPELRSEATFNQLVELILASPKRYAAFLNDKGEIDLPALEKAVNHAAHLQEQAPLWPLTSYGGALKGDLKLRLMLERSGSMKGYDARSGSGDFKRAVSEMITRFPGNSQADDAILIVNDGLYPYPGSFDTFVQDKDIFTSTASIGDPSYTDFAKIFAYALADTVPERVTVLVTDLIYSPEGTEATQAAKIFNEESALSASLFKKHLDKSMLIVRLSSDFNGLYYPFGASGGFAYKGRRPYYMVITGSAAAMSKLRTAEKYAGVVDFSSLPGFENMYFFNRAALPLTWWSIMPRKNAAQGEYTLAGGDSKTGSHALKDARPSKSSGELLLTVAADMSAIPAEEQYLLDAANYRIESDMPAEIASIKKVTPEMPDPRTRRYLSRATHLLELRVKGKSLPAQIKVNLLNKLPAWVGKGSARSDSNPASAAFPSTTFGLLPFLQGVYQAYYGTANTPIFTSFTVKFEN